MKMYIDYLDILYPIKELAKKLGENGIEILKKLGYYIIELEDLEMEMPKKVA